MKYLKRFNEDNKYKDEVEIIYKDKDMVCLIPKSQMMSYIFGFRTKWCSIEKTRFNTLTKDYNNVLIRFMFKEKNDANGGSFGYKLRLTYDLCTKKFNWSDTSGIHYLENEGNPFVIKETDYNSNERLYRIISKIKDIPEECKEIIYKYLNSETPVKYIFRNNEYKNNSIVSQRENYLLFKADSLPAILELIKSNPNYYIDTSFDKTKNRFLINYSIDGKKNIITKELKSFDEFTDALINILKEMLG